MKVAVLGEKKMVLAFKSLGVSVFGIEKEEDFQSAVSEIDSGDYSILFVTENVVAEHKTEFEAFFKGSLPAILIIPGVKNQEIGRDSLKKTIERALGSDLNL